MPFLICVPGSDSGAAGGPCDTIAAAVALRDALWQGSWGGQALLILDEETRDVVRPCFDCRGAGIVGTESCAGCRGSGRA